LYQVRHLRPKNPHVDFMSVAGGQTTSQHLHTGVAVVVIGVVRTDDLR
jgi:hypothetical protein